jgi:hypothetical protein
VLGADVGVQIGVGLALPVGEPLPPYPVPETPPFNPEERGFFDGDEVVLELELRDARTDQVIWANAVKGSVDPRDQAALASLLDGAFAGQSWVRPPQQTH